MHYLEWNNLIAQSLFNPQKAGEDVYLYLTPDEIIDLGHTNFEEETREEVWEQFVRKVRLGLPGSSQYPTIIDKALHAYEKWKAPGTNKKIDGVEMQYPPYIAYLVFLVLPLVNIDDTRNANNYYDRLDSFLLKNNINQNLRNRLKELEGLWDDLAAWLNVINHGDKGYFHLRNFTHKNWIYVGKIFSQCIFSPKAIKKLPELFLQAGMVPGSNYSANELRSYLLQYGSSILHLSTNVIETIRLSESNELGLSIIETVKKEYTKWTGESHSTDETGNKIKRNDVAARIYLQFKPFTNSGKIEFSYRLKSANEFPEDLTFGDQEVFEERAGYSRTLNFPFKHSFQIKDEFNKWIAKYPDKSVRLFINAGLLQFSNDYWIETDTLIKTNWMYLFCKNSEREIIHKWLEEHCEKFEDETEYSGMPDDCSLFKFYNPTEGLAEIAELTIFRDKSIQLVSSLKFDFRTFTNDFLPEVEILNSDGTEVVYLEYKNDQKKLYLDKSTISSNRWTIPENVMLYSNFVIKVENEKLETNEITYKIISSNESLPQLDESKLPKRDSFGWVKEVDGLVYSIGSNTVGSSLQKQLPYIHIFKSIQEDSQKENYEPVYNKTPGNTLLSFLSLKETLTIQEYYGAFEFLHSKYLSYKTDDKFNYSLIKRVSINFLDYLGYLDYEYQTKSIVVNPPQLVFVPTDRGRKVLLIGGRNSCLVDSIIATAPKYNLQVEITPQIESNEHLLLPDAITLRSFGNSQENFGENNLIAFAKELKLKFNHSEFAQLGLREFCSSIEHYKMNMFDNMETVLTFEDWDWGRYIFNPSTLRLEKSNNTDFDKTCSLLEYRLRAWEFHYRLWIDGKCFKVDRNWGQYIVLKHFGKQVIRKGNGKVAIPISLPLPRLLAESILLCSGIAPATKYIDGIGYRVYENIHSIFIDNLFIKLGQTPVIDNSL